MFLFQKSPGKIPQTKNYQFKNQTWSNLNNFFHLQLDRAHDQIVGPLEEFRKVHIGGVKENKKKYDKKTAKFCQAQEKFLNISSKKPGTVVVEVSYTKKYFSPFCCRLFTHFYTDFHIECECNRLKLLSRVVKNEKGDETRTLSRFFLSFLPILHGHKNLFDFPFKRDF